MKSILIIDDDPNVLEGMRESIPWELLQVRWVGEAIDGQEGLRLVRELHPDIVLTDINMPEMNGLEMIAALREEGFNGKFVILSGYSDFEYARQAVRLRVDDYLSKPVTMESLKTVLSRVTQGLEQDRSNESEYRKLQDQIKRYKPFVIQEWLKSILTGGPSEYTDEWPEIREIVADWNGRDHRILRLDLPFVQRWDAWERDRNLLRFAVQNVTSEMVRETFPAFDYVELHSRRYAVVLHGEPHRPLSGLEREAEWLRAGLASYLGTKLKVPVHIKLSRVQPDWRKLSDAFNGMLEQPEVAFPLFSSPERSFKFYQELAHVVRRADEKEARKVIAEFIGKHASGRPFDEQELRLWGAELWATLAYSLYDLGIELDLIAPKFDLPAELGGDASPEALGLWLERMVEIVMRSKHWTDNAKHRQMIDFAVRYVHEHYHENITLGLLADEIHISKNYLGQIFRNGTGETFNQYVTRIRMEKARQMILEGKLYIYEIAMKVGYSNIPYFSSQFKKFIGVNPADVLKNKP
ncbi:response regulator transcription factor [Cohnella sp. REN36]|uniref:response regulator transcription factor n=1 Tax=Cohnella sp. REN36 TaxID=2887347 RepID=UPI001D13AF36|nr:response regulator transcription factor [Cohnella sp. REN36]MCC3372011.1 response regulator transcription factor [Cohnella sp. REN36]